MSFHFFRSLSPSQRRQAYFDFNSSCIASPPAPPPRSTSCRSLEIPTNAMQLGERLQQYCEVKVPENLLEFIQQPLRLTTEAIPGRSSSLPPPKSPIDQVICMCVCVSARGLDGIYIKLDFML